ncbi:hypothetical protein L2E82_38943 [Cichorium intybus]|uniref:Uncharacterized protein n=1 Tax=Cichorium intybus TaxID=13427 RepID=A0ACB9AG29_CICIN|nr:hypothetical protein L2E82_38943 [Cichorium intybus]
MLHLRLLTPLLAKQLSTLLLMSVTSSCFGNENRGVMILRPCTGRSVDVTVVDLCPGCAANQVDLSREAFAVIANTDAGRINIEYNRI